MGFQTNLSKGNLTQLVLVISDPSSGHHVGQPLVPSSVPLPQSHLVITDSGRSHFSTASLN